MKIVYRFLGVKNIETMIGHNFIALELLPDIGIHGIQIGDVL